MTKDFLTALTETDSWTLFFSPDEALTAALRARYDCASLLLGYETDGTPHKLRLLLARNCPAEEALSAADGLTATATRTGKAVCLRDPSGKETRTVFWRDGIPTVAEAEQMLALATDARRAILTEALAGDERLYPNDERTARLIRARLILSAEDVSFVLVGENEIIRKNVRGIAPMADLLDEGRRFPDFAVADRIVGQAAAHLFLLAGVSAVHGEVMSDSAAKLLRENGVTVSYGMLTAAIRNRQGTGNCPMEEAVANALSHEDAYRRINEARAALRQAKK